MTDFDPASILNSILNRLCQIDRFGYFALPVTEAEAPGYHSVIDHPMCFSVMREKIEAKQYRTWGALLADFSLMLRNAFYFNDKKSYVYRVALQLNKEGNERLREVALEGRQAIYLQHPGGPMAAFEDEKREFEEKGLPPPVNPFLLVPPLKPTLKRSPLDVESDNAEWSHSEEAYSSFSDTDSEDEVRGQGCPSVMKLQNTLNVLRCIKQELTERGVVFRKFGKALSGDHPMIEQAVEWCGDRSEVERKAKWLELRILELQGYLDHYKAIDKAEESWTEAVHYRRPRTEHSDLAAGIVPEVAEAEDSCEDESYPARVYTSLGVLEDETAKLMTLLSARQRISQSKMLSAASTKKKTNAPRKKQSSSVDLLEPIRSRRDFDHSLFHSDSFGTPSSFEKPIKMNITVPNINEITSEKSEKWETAKKLLRQSLEADPTATIPQEVMTALQLSADEGSSEEDIADETYIARHQDMEVAERERHLCMLGPIDPKRKKLPEKRPKRSASFRQPAKQSRTRPRSASQPSGSSSTEVPWNVTTIPVSKPDVTVPLSPSNQI